MTFLRDLNMSSIDKEILTRMFQRKNYLLICNNARTEKANMKSVCRCPGSDGKR